MTLDSRGPEDPKTSAEFLKAFIGIKNLKQVLYTSTLKSGCQMVPTKGCQITFFLAFSLRHPFEGPGKFLKDFQGFPF